MRDRKLLDQTPPLKEAGTLVSLSRLFSRSCGGKVKKIVRPTVNDGSVVMRLRQSVPWPVHGANYLVWIIGSSRELSADC